MKTTYKQLARIVVDQMQSESPAAISKAIAAYLVEERRVGELDKIMREVEQIRHKEQDVLEVSAQSAHELTADVKKQITELFEEKNVLINETINQDLVGGVRLQAQDTLLDLSVRGQLNRLKAHKF